MALLKTQFGGLNTDVYPNRLPSGTADRILNCTVKAGDLYKRQGFALVEDDVQGAAGVLNMTVAHFADGDVYIVCKVGAVLYHRKIYPTDAESFTAITSNTTHHSTDRGWFFMWADRLHYFDQNGGSRWNPDVNSGTAYKAGLCRPTVSPVGVAASGGEKEGHYHVVAAYRNGVTKEVGAVSTAQSPTIECRIVGDTGGITIDNWKTGGVYTADQTVRDNTTAAKYEWDEIAFYTTTGNSEYIGLGSGVECYSYRAYLDAICLKSASTAGLNKSDHVLSVREAFTNSGGEPPNSTFGCYDGSTAVYGGIYESSALVKGKLSFSIPGFPTMVPKEQSYSIGGDAKTFIPKPWTGEITTGVPGAMNSLAAGGGVIALFSPVSTFLLQKGETGKLTPRLLLPSVGCVAQAACIGTSDAVHALGHKKWTAISSGSHSDISKLRFTATLAEIPAGYASTTIAGHYSAENEIWMAVARPNGTKAQRILIFDATENKVTVFEPACLGTRATYSTNDAGAANNDLTFTAEIPGAPGNSISVTLAAGGTAGKEAVSVSGKDITVTLESGVSTGTQVMTAFNNCPEAVEIATCTLKGGNDGTGVLAAIAKTSLTGGTGDKGITAMCEMALPNAAPVMLIATDGGTIYKYPSGTNDAGVEFNALWRGYFGQERSQSGQRLSSCNVHTGASVSGNVRVSARSLRTGGESVSHYTKIINKSSLVDRPGVEFDIVDGNLFQLAFFSPHSVTARWGIRDLSLDLERV